MDPQICNASDPVVDLPWLKGSESSPHLPAFLGSPATLPIESPYPVYGFEPSMATGSSMASAPEKIFSLLASEDSDPLIGPLPKLPVSTKSALPSPAGYLSQLPGPSDDFAASTSTSGVLSLARSLAGRINSKRDIDWIRFDVTPAQTYRFTVAGGSLATPRLAVRSASGQVLSSQISSAGRRTDLLFAATSAESIYLIVSALKKKRGTYTLTASLDQDAADVSASLDTTASITSAQALNGSIGTAGDRDWYRTHLLQGTTYQIKVAGLDQFDPTLSLRSASGSELAFNDDSDEGADSLLNFTPSQTDDYFLDVGGYSLGTGEFSLAVADVTPRDDYAASLATAGLLQPGASVTGVISAASPPDQDWFRIRLTAGQTYQFNADGVTLSDPTLTLRSADGSELAFNDDYNELSSQINFYADETADYYLDVSAFNLGSGIYHLSATDLTPQDDYLDRSDTLGLLLDSLPSTGVIERGGDRDWFRASLVAGVTYQFNLDPDLMGVSPPLEDPTLNLLDDQGSLLDSNDDFSGNNSRIVFTPMRSGLYFLDVGGYATQTGAYQLSQQATVAPVVETDLVPGDPTSAAQHQLATSTTGLIDFGLDHDWYRLSLVAGRTYQFSVQGDRSTDHPLSDPTLALSDATGRQLDFNDDFDGLEPQLTYTPVISGDYFLDVGAYSGLIGAFILASIEVTPNVDSLDDYLASNLTTGELQIGAPPIEAVINSDADRDWFRVALQAGRSFGFKVEGLSLQDPDLTLRDAQGTAVGNVDDSGGSRSPCLTYVAPADGIYFVDVSSHGNLGVGSYAVTVYDLLDGDDFSADVATNGRLLPGSMASGDLETSGDRDWFAIDLPATTTYTFRVTGQGLDDPVMSLLSADGSELASNDDFNARDPQITFTPSTPGRYYLDVGGYGAAVGTYQIAAVTTVVPAPQQDDYGSDRLSCGQLSLARSLSGAVQSAGDRDWFALALQASRTYAFEVTGSTLPSPNGFLLDDAGRRLEQSDVQSSTLAYRFTATPRQDGTYFLDVGAFGLDTGAYRIDVIDQTPGSDRIAGLSDPSIRSDVNLSLQGDNLFGHRELADLLLDAGESGITAVELSDLRIISSGLAPFLSDSDRIYSQYIYDAVVNGNPANAWFTGGSGERQRLGNLTISSSQQQLSRLVDKWFFGLDLPLNAINGDAAAGAAGVSFSYGALSGTTLFDDGISSSDINQGRAGTCYFLAAAASIANSQPRLIRELFRDNGDGTYGVRFYGCQGSEVWVTVNRQIPVNPSGDPLLATNARRSMQGELWVSLLEKAYAQANEIGVFGRDVNANSYGAIEGGFEDALRYISGSGTTAYSVEFSRTGWVSVGNDPIRWRAAEQQAIDALTSSRPMIALSYGTTELAGKIHFVPRHVFSVLSYDRLSGLFTLANPWGAGGFSYAPSFQASWDDLFGVRAIVAWA